MYLNVYLSQNGYPLETHHAQTEDGYILTLHRIPHGRKESASTDDKDRKPPVFLMHGLLCSSVDWVILGPGKAMALMLADAGYDVWLGNNRGNTFSRNHVSLDPDRDSKTFYNYSYHEIGKYDLPGMIDYVLKSTGFAKLTYVGYSEGFTSFTVMGSIRPEYNDKILLMNAFAPVTNMHAITSWPINTLARFPVLLKLAKMIGWNEMFTKRIAAKVFRNLCRLRFLCKLFFEVTGSSPEQLADHEFLMDILINFPAGMSWKQIAHYVQGTQSGLFRPFDYGSVKNVEVYGRKDPPAYDLTKVTAPIILYYGESDCLINNGELLGSVAKQLPNVVGQFLVPYSNFNHLDFIYGKEISLLNIEALKNIQKVNREIS
ncbi:lipase 1-like isoform X2 [Sitophilus oryzae]|uniref:Lipase n=1 Tax=Sitophilus oryzae TaxID=7048 RepID=A0A6J2XVL6_SITOR|nr:lipase 1-like isoform X2 [Sitophilus oryzae]